MNSRNRSKVEILIVATGTANTASVMASLTTLGFRPSLSRDPAEVISAPLVVLPGVGSFGAAASQLEDLGLFDPLKERVRNGRGTLGICLGMQLLFEGSEESPGVSGLGVVPGVLQEFPKGARVPHMGWNEVTPCGTSIALPGLAYFANSYRLQTAPEGWRVATTEYEGDFVSVVERGAVLGCQFHPELSGVWGQQLIRRWVQRCVEVSPC